MNTTLKITLAGVLAMLGAQIANAGLSIDQSSSFMSNGSQTTIKSGVSPSDFEPGVIAFRVTNSAGMMRRLWGITPQPVTKASLQAAEQAQSQAASIAAESVRYLNVQGVFQPPITQWVAWGIQANFIDPNYYARVLAVCLVQGNSTDAYADGAAYRRQICQVGAYIQAYTMNPRGYAGGNMIGLVPLCEVEQQNDCNITGGAFNPFLLLKREDAERAVEARKQAAIDHQRALMMHKVEMQRYEAIKAGKTPPPVPDYSKIPVTLPQTSAPSAGVPSASGGFVPATTRCREMLPGGDSNPGFPACVLQQDRISVGQP